MTQKERLVELIKPYMLGLSAANCEKLAEYLIHNGVIMPPCKVGDTVYIVPKGNIIIEEIVKTIEKYNGDLLLVCCTNDWTLHSWWFGKFVFLAREEAEQALKEREET